MWQVFFYYFGIPNGAVWGNILAEPIIFVMSAITLYMFRNKLMRRFVAFHHRHKTEHEARLARLEKDKNEHSN
jgi:hypothetical protein